MNYVFESLNQQNTILNDAYGNNVRILENGDAYFKNVTADVITGNTINGAVIMGGSVSDGSITLAKMANLSANSIIGNNTGVSATPLALNSGQVKSMLSLDQVDNISLSSWTGSTNITTVANGAISLAEMSNLAVNSIIGNNTAFSIAPKALNVSEVRSMLSLNFVDNVSINSWTGSANIVTVGNIPNLVAGSVKINTGLNMSSTNITSLNNINGFSLPASNFVGISDAQTLTNKTINASQLVAKSVTLDKMANIGAVSLLGNVNAFETSPAAISAVNVKTMLDLAGSNLGDQNLIGDVTSTGGTTLTTTIASGAVTLAKMSNLAANSIIGNNTGVSATPKALTTSEVKSLLNLLGNLTITNNDITSSTGILNATIANINFTTSTLLSISGQKITFSTTNLSIDLNENTTSIDVTGVLNMKNYNITNAGTIYSDSHISKTTNGNLSLAANGSGVVSMGSSVNMNSNNLTNVNTINGVSIPNSGIVGVSSVQTLTNKIINGDQLVLNSVALSRLTSIDAQSFIGNKEFLTGVPQILSATQAKTVLSLQNVQNINVSTWTGTNTINTVGALSSGSIASGFGAVNCGAITCDSITGKSSTLLLNAVGSNFANVATNNLSFLVSSTIANEDSYIGINGPTVTKGRYVACYQGGTYKLAFGLQASSNFFVYDPVGDRTMFQTDIGAANPIRFPTYTTEGTAYISAGGTIIRTSDRRLKQDEELLIPAVSLQQIMNLQPKKYRWISEPNRVKIGFIAQDVETSIPEAVDGKKFEYELIRDGTGPGVDGTVRLDEEGNPVLDYNTPRYRGLDNCAILSVLVSAVQELVQKNNLLEARIAILESYEYIEA